MTSGPSATAFPRDRAVRTSPPRRSRSRRSTSYALWSRDHHLAAAGRRAGLVAAKANLLAILRELVLFRDGERVASLAPSPRQHGAATAIGHAGQEAKLADALDPLGLIRSLRHSGSPFPILDRDE